MKIPTEKFTIENFNTAREIFKEDENQQHGKNFGLIQPSVGKRFPDEQDITIAIKYAQHDLAIRGLTASVKENGDKKEFFNEEELQESQSFSNNQDGFKAKIMGFFDKNRDKADFDKWHEETCDAAMEVLKEFYKKNGICYGNAQKWVNMTLKYLYCMLPNGSDNKKDYEEYFRYCHIPIDSIMLDWVKRKRKGFGKISTWSTLNYDTYKKIIDATRDIVDNDLTNIGKLTPLQVEFIIWPRMKLKQSSEAFLTSLGKKKSKTKKDSLKDNLKEIQNEMSQYT